MTEIAQWGVIFFVLTLVSVLSYMAGRDAAERASADTIAHLRNVNRRMARERDRRP